MQTKIWIRPNSPRSAGVSQFQRSLNLYAVECTPYYYHCIRSVVEADAYV